MRVVVFKNAAAVYELRCLLFGSYEAQKQGIAKCKAYEIRGPLPPSVHATCLLLAAVHGDVPSCDLYVIRQAYAMAIVRFVNETLDAVQVGKTVVPLHILAVETNLPSAFVELRHAATHEDLPSVYVLRDMAQRALAWLYDQYWVKQLPPPNAVRKSKTKNGIEEKEEEEEDSSDTIKGLFREWRRMKRSQPDLTAVPTDLATQLQTEFELNTPEFIDVCLCRNILVPAGSGPVKNTNAVVAMWMPLFQRLGSECCGMLADRVLAQLSEREWPVSPAENRKFRVFEAWADALATYLSTDAVKLAMAAPRPWNSRIVAKYAASRGDNKLFDIAKEMAVFTGVVLDIEMKVQTQGWPRVSEWNPRPIGCR